MLAPYLQRLPKRIEKCGDKPKRSENIQQVLQVIVVLAMAT